MLKTFTGFQSYGGEQKLKTSLNSEAATDRADGAESVAAVDRDPAFISTSGATDGDKLVLVRGLSHKNDTYERRTSKEKPIPDQRVLFRPENKTSHRGSLYRLWLTRPQLRGGRLAGSS